MSSDGGSALACSDRRTNHVTVKADIEAIVDEDEESGYAECAKAAWRHKELVQAAASGSPSHRSGSLTASPLRRRAPPAADAAMLKVRAIVPKLTDHLRKGQCGRVCIFGGSFNHTGPAFLAGMAALRTGADLVHIMCEREAGNVIKAYSPELVVHPVLDTEYAMEEIDQWLPQFHAVVLGPGLGRNQSTLGRIGIIIEKVRNANVPIVVDADGLWLLTHNPKLIHGYKKAVLTPNAAEFSRLAMAVLKRPHVTADCGQGISHGLSHGHGSAQAAADAAIVGEVARAMGGVTIVHKGQVDIIANGKYTERCSEEGCPRRCGGQGDLVSGACSVFLLWGHRLGDNCPAPGFGVLAGWAACRLVRAAAAQAFAARARGTTTADISEEIATAFHRLYESETSI